jgi:hypothetical protein
MKFPELIFETTLTLRCQRYSKWTIGQNGNWFSIAFLIKVPVEVSSNRFVLTLTVSEI